MDAAGAPVANAVVELLSSGVNAEYFEPSERLRGLPNLTGATSLRRTRVTAINMRGPADLVGPDPFATGLAPDYAARLTGLVSIATAGTYTFTLGTNEGARLSVAGQVVIDTPVPVGGGYEESTGTIDLEPGMAPVEVTFYQGNVGAQLQLSVTPPGGSAEVVQPADLTPAAGPFVVATDSEGRFALPTVPTALEHVRLRVTRPSGGTVDILGPSAGPLPSGETDVGVITISSAR